MNVIIPMAGMGKRMRPHTLTVPKPLIKLKGSSIVELLVKKISRITDEPIDEIGFVVGKFGSAVENELLDLAKRIGAKGKIFYQHEALGTAHAIACASEILRGKTIVAFADTLFKADFKIDRNQDAIIFIHAVENPSSFGVVKTNNNNIVTDFIEKPSDPVSNKAIIGIYYFKEGTKLREEISSLIERKEMHGGEYQITDALESMKNNGISFSTQPVNEWLDCGNKDATVYTHSRILEFHKDEALIDKSLQKENTNIIGPCYIGKNVKIINSIIGPYVSLGDHCVVENAIISNSIIQNSSSVTDVVMRNSMVGNHTSIRGKQTETSLGDFSSYIE